MKSVILFSFVLLSFAACNTSKPAIESNQTSDTETISDLNEEWEFCQCIVKLDSIVFAIESDKLTIEQTDKLMQRWEFVDQKCKEFTTFDNSTPESRQKHEKRVRKCLE